MPATCAIVGIGGLGAPATALLATLGGCDLRLIDDDCVENSNLPRQPLFGNQDLGTPKAQTAARHIKASQDRSEMPPGEVEFCATRLSEANVSDLLAGVAVVVDGSDNLATKRLLNRWCCGANVALIHAGAVGWEGQLTTILPGRSACLECLFPDLAEESAAGSCDQDGVLGPVVGAIGLAAAREAHACLEGTPPPLAGRFGILNGRTLTWRSIAISRRPNCPACGQLA